MSRNGRTPLAICLLALALGPVRDAAAQRFEESPFEEYLPPPPEEIGQPAPKLTFRLLEEIELPGPLPAGGPRLAGDVIEIPVAGGRAVANWRGEARLRLEPPAAPSPPAPPDGRTAYGVAPDGRYRAAALDYGWVVAEKQCPRCADGWRRAWKLRVAGSEFARPLVTDGRLFYGATDNRVYCVKRRNGHRIWARDVGGRVSRPLELWSPPASDDPAATTDSPAPLDLRLVLVVPDGGGRLLALDARNGQPVAEYEFPENETVVGRALATPNGRIAVARQKYNTREASLSLFDLSRVVGGSRAAAARAAGGRSSPP